MNYRRHEITLSDHRPISATFHLAVRTLDTRLYNSVKDSVLQSIASEYIPSILNHYKIRWLMDGTGCSHQAANEFLNKFGGELRLARDEIHNL